MTTNAHITDLENRNAELARELANVSERFATARRAGDNLRGYALLLLAAVPPPEEHRAKFDRLRRAAARWDSLRAVDFSVPDEAAAEAAKDKTQSNAISEKLRSDPEAP